MCEIEILIIDETMVQIVSRLYALGFTAEELSRHYPHLSTCILDEILVSAPTPELEGWTPYMNAVRELCIRFGYGSRGLCLDKLQRGRIVFHDFSDELVHAALLVRIEYDQLRAVALLSQIEINQRDGHVLSDRSIDFLAYLMRFGHEGKIKNLDEMIRALHDFYVSTP